MEDPMMTVTCTMIEAMLAQYESLNAKERDIIAAHIAECASCRDSLDLVEAFGDMLREEAAAAMPADMTDQVMAALHNRPMDAPDNRPFVFLAVLVVIELALLLQSSGSAPPGISDISAFWNTALGILSAWLEAFTDAIGAITAFFSATVDSLSGLARPDAVAAAVAMALTMCGASLLRDTRMKGHEHA
jgi:anti-sigma factor RsiW